MRITVPCATLSLVLFAFAIYALSPVQGGTTCSSSLSFTSESGVLKVNGERYRLKGLSWFGFETSNNVVHGIWAVDYKALLDFIQTNGFNAMRLPFYLELALNDATPNSINYYNMNEDLKNLTSLQVLDKIILEAGKRGIMIMLDLHSFLPGTFMQDCLWYDAAHPEAVVLQMWDKITARYGKTWNVIAIDLKNEPHCTTWGAGNNQTDWNTAAGRIGSHVQATGGNFLIFVEGTATSPACTDACFWGENLQGAASNPVKLTQQNKLVYSPHCYGPSVAYQTYFQVPEFPKNMPAIWQQHYGFVPKQTGNAVVIGEWGGLYSGSDQTWLDAYVAWLSAQDTTDQFFWCLNPDSGDTGGLLGYDWKTPDTQKLALLQKLVPSPTVFSINSQGQYCVTN